MPHNLKYPFLAPLMFDDLGIAISRVVWQKLYDLVWIVVLKLDTDYKKACVLF